jgi:signal transduction histidine kinase
MNAVDPIEILDPVLAKAESWGRFKFLDADLHQVDLEGHWVMFPRVPNVDPEGWHPANVLIGVLSDDDGQMVGVLSVDRPVSGRRPDAAQRSLMEKFAAQAERAVLTAFEREALVQQVAYAESARQLIRSASMPVHASLLAVLQHTHVPLVKGFGAGGSWIQVLDPVGVGYARKGSGDMLDLSDDLIAVAHELAPALWAAQEALIITVGESPEVPAAVHRELEAMGVSSALAVALGAGTECVGFLALSRFEEHPPWSQVEIDSALDIGHDLGAALKTAQALERERALVRELQQLDDYRSQLIATLSHELRTPLAVLRAQVELLDRETDEARRHEATATLLRRLDEMDRLVSDMLTLAGAEAGRLVQPRPFDLDDFFEDVRRDLPLFGERDFRVEPVGGTLHADPDRLTQVLRNLVRNAVAHTEPGGRVSVVARAHDGRLTIAVSDDGPGIPAEHLERVFERFHRIDASRARQRGGTGLGLPIARAIVEAHGGHIRADSTPGAGATITLELPGYQSAGPGAGTRP